MRTAAIKLYNNVFGSQGENSSVDYRAETSSGDHSQEEDFPGYFQGDSDDEEEPDEDDGASYDDQFNLGEGGESPNESTVDLQAENDFVCSAIAVDSDGPFDNQRKPGPWCNRGPGPRWIFEDEDGNIGKFIARAYEDEEADDPCWAWLGLRIMNVWISRLKAGWTWEKFSYCDVESGVGINIEYSHPDLRFDNVNPHESDFWEYVDDGHIELMIVGS